MGSVPSVNPGVANLLQTLSNVNSPVLSSPSVVSALESAPTTDIVQLSQSAAQLETVDMLFGIPNPSVSSGSAALNSLLADVESSQTTQSVPASSSSSTATTATTTGAQLASEQSASQLAEAQELFGTGTTPALSDSSLLNLIG